jgi:hypothetical protein
MFQVFLIGVSYIFGDFDLKISHSVACSLSKLVSYSLTYQMILAKASKQ